MKKLLLITILSFALLLVSCADTKTPVETPDLSDPTLSIHDCIEVPYSEDLSSYIEIERADYFGIELEKLDATATTEDIENAIYSDLSELATLVDVTDKGAKYGDTIVIDFKGFVDGVAFQGGEATDHEMVLGQAGFIDGFEEALVGHKAGEEFTIDVTFPEDYSEDLAGKNAQFEIKMKSVKEPVLPELTDALVKEKLGFETVTEYITALTEEVSAEKQTSVKDEMTALAYSKIRENVKFNDYPDKEYEYYYNDFVSYYEEQAKTLYNMDLPTFITSVAGSTEDEFYYYADMNAANIVEQELVFFSIAKAEGLIDSLKKADYDAFLAKLAPLYSMTPEAFEKEYGAEEIWKSVIWEKAMDFVINNSVSPSVPETAE